MNFPNLLPEPSALTRPMWDAAAEGALALQWCCDCQKAIYYPRYVCPECWGQQLEWRHATGNGTIYAKSRHWVAGHDELAELVPYTVALIDLAEGVRMLALLHEDAQDAPVGSAVQLSWGDVPGGRRIPSFNIS